MDKLQLGAEWQKQVLDAFRLLPGSEREVLTLHALAGMTVSEIADVLGLTPEKVGSSIRRARTKLRELIQKQQPRRKK